MDAPKISVLIPMYNRKHYIQECIDSALNQTFQDYEIIIRDDCSTSGAYELVEKNYATEISSGKIKLFRNEKNIGEAFNLGTLLRDATGKYLTILHDDDLYLPNTLQHLYEVAEKFSADVVHSTHFLTSAKDGVIREGTRLKRISNDRHLVNEVEVMPSDLTERFREWLEVGTFQDVQYNIFRRKLITDNEIFFFPMACETLLFELIWLMRAKVFVKTPEVVYIRRDAPDSQTNDTNAAIYQFETGIPLKLAVSRAVDKFLSECDFFKDNDELKYYVKTKIFNTHESLTRDANVAYGDKAYVEMYTSIEDTFRKYFGADAGYIAMLFHWSHLMHFNKSKAQELLIESLKILSRDI